MAERNLAGKIALITGAGRKAGLGQAIARRLARHGAARVLHDRARCVRQSRTAHSIGTQDDLEAMAGEIRALGVEVMTVACDLLDEAAIAALMKAVAERFGRLDILVNNAGIGYLFGPLVDMRRAEFDACSASIFAHPPFASSMPHRS